MATSCKNAQFTFIPVRSAQSAGWSQTATKFISDRGRQSFSRSSHLVGTTSLSIQIQTLRTQLCASRSAPRSYSVGRQRGKCSKKDLIRNLVGTLMSHWQDLFQSPHMVFCHLGCIEFHRNNLRMCTHLMSSSFSGKLQ